MDDVEKLKGLIDCGALVLSTGGAVLDYRAALGDDVHPLVSHHGGLTPAEMQIPLVVA